MRQMFPFFFSLLCPQQGRGWEKSLAVELDPLPGDWLALTHLFLFVFEDSASVIIPVPRESP